jgi:hypothetical protein
MTITRDRERGFRSRKFVAFLVASGAATFGFLVATKWPSASANLPALYGLLSGALTLYLGSNVVTSHVELKNAPAAAPAKE